MIVYSKLCLCSLVNSDSIVYYKLCLCSVIITFSSLYRTVMVFNLYSNDTNHFPSLTPPKASYTHQYMYVFLALSVSCKILPRIHGCGYMCRYVHAQHTHPFTNATYKETERVSVIGQIMCVCVCVSYVNIIVFIFLVTEV